MIANDKPNPFRVLRLPTSATNAQIAKCLKELRDIAKLEEQALFTWAKEAVMTHSLTKREYDTRLEYEMFEVPGTQYENTAWEEFVEENEDPPKSWDSTVEQKSPPSLEDFNIGALTGLALVGVLTAPEGDITPAIVHAPFSPGQGPLLLEVRDVIFG